MISMNFIVYFRHFCKLIIYLSIKFNVKIINVRDATKIEIDALNEVTEN